LRDPDSVIALAEDPIDSRRVASAALGLLIGCGMAFGAAVGSFRGNGQAALSAVKIPCATLLMLSVSGPALWAILRACGRHWSFRKTLALMLAAGARSGLVLLGAAPLIWLAIAFGLPYSMVKQIAALAYGVAGLSALSISIRALGPEPGRVLAIGCFIGVFAIAGAQSAWLLRPYIGDPQDAKPPLFAQGRVEGGVLGALIDAPRRSER
jgi:hypothetical protein